MSPSEPMQQALGEILDQIPRWAMVHIVKQQQHLPHMEQHIIGVQTLQIAMETGTMTRIHLSLVQEACHLV